MKEYKIGEVFEDSENFNPPKRLICVIGSECKGCVYDVFQPCPDEPVCNRNDRRDKTDVVFIEP